MGSEEISIRREVSVTQPVEAGLIVGREAESEDQRRRVERWFALTQDILPAMAAAQRWPIRLDHCFMRVLLDNALGTAWFRVVARPAIRHLTPAQFDPAVALGDAVQADPALLPELNQRSLDWRRRLLV